MLNTIHTFVAPLSWNTSDFLGEPERVDEAFELLEDFCGGFPGVFPERRPKGLFDDIQSAKGNLRYKKRIIKIRPFAVAFD